jgi:hypothetical protein
LRKENKNIRFGIKLATNLTSAEKAHSSKKAKKKRSFLMKNKIVTILCSIMAVALITGCTKYASPSPTPETPATAALPQAAAPTLGLPSPTLVALEVVVATRTPIPLVLKTATPTASLAEILTATLPEGAITVDPILLTQQAQPGYTPVAVTPQNELTATAQAALYGTNGTPSANVFPTRAPFVISNGTPTIAIVNVKYADSITVSITKLVPGTVLKIRMGSPRSYGTDGPVVDTVTADASGSVINTYKIPAAFIGFGQIEFRIEFPDGTPNAFFFSNQDY